MTESSASWDRILVQRDGNAVCALVGKDLVVGEAEFVPLPFDPTEEDIETAGQMAVAILQSRFPATLALPIEYAPPAEWLED